MKYGLDNDNPYYNTYSANFRIRDNYTIVVQCIISDSNDINKILANYRKVVEGSYRHTDINVVAVLAIEKAIDKASREYHS